MRRRNWCPTILMTMVLLAPSAFTQQRGGQEAFGPYEPVPDWPRPLPDGPDGVKHEGWTWGSVGSVYAESADRIWVAMRGELPLPEGARPWTPYALLDPPRRATGNDDGRNARCEPTEPRGWERRYHYVAEVFNGRVQKFRPKPGFAPKKAVGQEVRYKASSN